MCGFQWFSPAGVILNLSWEIGMIEYSYLEHHRWPVPLCLLKGASGDNNCGKNHKIASIVFVP